jgi:RNA polymerase sigma-70 factor, ECF subfamily
MKVMNEKENELIRKAQKGDTVAFEAILRTYERQVLTLAQQVVQNQHDAEDIAQEVFITLYRKISLFRFESSFFSWLYRIVMNTSFNYVKGRRYHEFLTNEEDEDKYYAVADDNSSDMTESEDFQEHLKEALCRLPEKQRTVFIMRHSQHLKIKEIADILGVGDGTVKKYLFRATEKLRSLLRPYKTQLLEG